MTTHVIKIEPRWYNALVEGRKTSELRFDDRDYQTGDQLQLREYDPQHRFAVGYMLSRAFNPQVPDDRVEDDPRLTGREVTVTVSHVLKQQPGLKKGWVVLSFTADGASDD